jgi:hypothetical protein
MATAQSTVTKGQMKAGSDSPPVQYSAALKQKKLRVSALKVDFGVVEALGSLPEEKLQLLYKKVQEREREVRSNEAASAVPPGFYSNGQMSYMVVPDLPEDNALAGLIVTLAKALKIEVKVAKYSDELFKFNNMTQHSQQVVLGIAMSVEHKQRVTLTKRRQGYLLGMSLGFAQRIKGEFVSLEPNQGWDMVLKKNNFFFGNNPGEVNVVGTSESKATEKVGYGWSSVLLPLCSGFFAIPFVDMITKAFHKLRLTSLESEEVDKIIFNNLVPFNEFVQRYSYWLKEYDRKSRKFEKAKRKMPEIPGSSPVVLPGEMKLIRGLAKYIWSNLDEVSKDWPSFLLGHDSVKDAERSVSTCYRFRQDFLERFARFTTSRLRSIKRTVDKDAKGKNTISRSILEKYLVGRDLGLHNEVLAEILKLIPRSDICAAVMVYTNSNREISEKDAVEFLKSELISIYKEEVPDSKYKGEDGLKLQPVQTPKFSEDEEAIRFTNKFIAIRKILLHTNMQLKSFHIRPTTAKLEKLSESLNKADTYTFEMSEKSKVMNIRLVEIMLGPYLQSNNYESEFLNFQSIINKNISYVLAYKPMLKKLNIASSPPFEELWEDHEELRPVVSSNMKEPQPSPTPVQVGPKASPVQVQIKVPTSAANSAPGTPTSTSSRGSQQLPPPKKVKKVFDNLY